MDCENRSTPSTSPSSPCSSVSLESSLDSGLLSSQSQLSSSSSQPSPPPQQQQQQQLLSPGFSDAEWAFLDELALLNDVIDRILPIVNRNPEETLLSAVCDLACRLIARSGCSLGPRTYYVFSNLYRETAALETRSCLARHATAEVVAYIREHFHEQQKKQKRQQQQAKRSLQIEKHFGQEVVRKEEAAKQEREQQLMELQLSIIVNVLKRNIEDPCSGNGGFAPLIAALRELDLLKDEKLVGLFVFTTAEAKLMIRACREKDDAEQ